MTELEKVKQDADTMFNALFAIISDVEIDDLEKCMQTAENAISSLLDKGRFDTNRSR